MVGDAVTRNWIVLTTRGINSCPRLVSDFVVMFFIYKKPNLSKKYDRLRGKDDIGS